MQWKEICLVQDIKKNINVAAVLKSCFEAQVNLGEKSLKTLGCCGLLVCAVIVTAGFLGFFPSFSV